MLVAIADGSALRGSAPPLAISPTSVSMAPLGSQTFSASGGTGPYAYSMHTNASGGSVNATTGVYTAGTTGSVSDVVRVTDAALATADATVSVTAALAISPTTATVAQSANQTFTGSNGSGGYAYSVPTNNSGASINSGTGVYTAGASGGASTVIDTVRVTDSNTATADATVTVPGVAPPAPPSSGLKVWLKADAGVTHVGAAISNWADQSGNGNDYAQASSIVQPGFDSSAINGLPAITFINQYLTNTAFSLSGARTVVVVRKLGSTAAGPFWTPWTLVDGSGHPSWFFYTNGGGGSYHNYNFIADVTPSNDHSTGVNGTLDTAWHVDEWTYNGSGIATPGNYTLALDAATQTLVNDTGIENSTGSTTTNSLGVDFGNGDTRLSDFFNGSIAEFLVYDHDLSGPDVTTLRTYLEAKYALALGAP